MADRLLHVTLRDLYLRYPCTCSLAYKLRSMSDPQCIGCDLRAEFGPETNEPPKLKEIPWSTFKRPICRSIAGCGNCEKCSWLREQGRMPVWPR